MSEKSPAAIPRVCMSRPDAAEQLRLFGWRDRTIELLLYPVPHRQPFIAGDAAERIEITVINDSVKPVRSNA